MGIDDRTPDVSYRRIFADMRAKIGLTLEKLAAATEISVSDLSEVERGERLPSLVQLRQVASACGVSLDDLLGEIIKRTPPDEVQHLEGSDLGPIPSPR